MIERPFAYWNYSPYFLIVVLVKLPWRKANMSTATKFTATALGRGGTLIMLTRLHFLLRLGLAFPCCSHFFRPPLTSTSLFAADDGRSDEQDQTADNDHRRYGEDRRLCCTGCILDAEYVPRNWYSTNIRLLCIIIPNSLRRIIS